MQPTHIRVASDLHLEGFFGRDYETLGIDFLPKDDRDAASILVLAGDISSRPDQLIGFLRVCAQRFAHVLFVPGNHEYYKHDFKVWNRDMRSALDTLNGELSSNITFCMDDVAEVVLGGTRFLLATLWGDGGKDVVERTWVDRGLNDFRLIRLDDSRFTVMDMIRVHKEQKAELVKRLKTTFDGKTVVVSHHMPSYRLCHPRFGTDINGGFASNSDDILAYDHAPAVWIHGHTHDTGDGLLWKTRIVCNPAGYRGEWSTSFNTFMNEPKFLELANLHG